MSISINLPKFTLLEKNNLGSCCDGCGRTLKNVYVVRNNETKKTGHFGSGCFKKFTDGKSITEVVEEQKLYEKAVKQTERDEIQEANGRSFIESFQEAEPEMLEFILNNLDNNFVKNMKERIETSGSLTKSQYESLFRMMRPFAVFNKDEKVTLKVFPSKVEIRRNNFGYNDFEYLVIAFTENDELVKIYFSSLNEQKEKVLIDSNVLDFDNGSYIGLSYIEKNNPILVSGVFDGYKIKRAKITKV